MKKNVSRSRVNGFLDTDGRRIVNAAGEEILLMGWGYSVGRWGADGDFGADTEAAVRRFQGWSGLEADGICGPKTWGRLLGM